jgi:hypothetical protein
LADLARTNRGPVDQDASYDEEEYGTPEDTDDVENFLFGVVKRFNEVESYESVNRREGVDDLRFRKGDQWPEAIKSSRTIDKRPCLTINKLPTFIHQIVNDQRQNRPAINVSPVGDGSDPEVAKMLKGLIKYIERCSNADVAYDTGFESAVTIGWGFWRVLTDYEGPDTFDQTIHIKRISNPFTVYLDPNADEPDGSDAQWGFITDMLPREEYREMYPDFPLEAWNEDGVGDEYKNWSTQTHVRIAEYFYYEHTERTLLALSNGHVGWEDELADEILDEIDANPDMIVNERVVEDKKVKWCKLTAYDILEEQEWPGKYIPIIRVIGDEINLEGRISYQGIVRAAKDPQRMYNFWCTSETELIALAPKAPWIMEEGQIEGHEQRWADANIKSLPFLLYKGTNVAGKPAPPPQRQQFAGPPTGVVQAKISAAQDMQAVTGIRFDATQQERMYDESGKALRELKRVGDLGNYHYIDNLSRSLKYTGRILIDLIPKVFDTPRILTILREDGSEQMAKLDPNLPQPYEKREEGDEVQLLYNPKLGDYDVTVTVGPSFATKRQEAADSMLQFMQAVPQSGPLIGDLISKNMDWPGAEEISSRLASMLPPHLLDEKLEQLPPEAKALVSSLMQQMEQLKAEHDKAVAMLGDNEADRQVQRDKIEADTMTKMEQMSADMVEKFAELQVKMLTDNSTAGDGSDDADLAVQLIKIQADQEAKFAKIQADLEAKYMDKIADMQVQLLTMQHESKLAQSEQKGAMERETLKSDTQKGMRRQDDLAKFEKMHKEMADQVKDLGKRMKEFDNFEVVFDRDPQTKRIAKARRVPRSVQ